MNLFDFFRFTPALQMLDRVLQAPAFFSSELAVGGPSRSLGLSMQILKEFGLYFPENPLSPYGIKGDQQ